ncbi:hypothetical protein SteCoe_32081 [Stentor coeruleus]|uniref:Uncharacterized protein n=1 Tax=Stentor coeruleus TaxID=5963 RepID=A0A1R2AZS5_9CILI|nr:hypothetical protein SteCoe_32081 [Stentor coeruleus]
MQMKLVLASKSPNSSVYSSETETLDHYFRVSNLPAIKQLFEANPEKLNHKEPRRGWSPLFRAVMYGSIEITRFLLDSGAAPNEMNNLGETPLHQAADNCLCEIAEVLLAYGAEPNIQQTDGNTPLHNAVLRSNIEIAELFLKNGADPNIQDLLVIFIKFGKTCLHLASELEHQEMIDLLIQYNASQEIKDFSGKVADLRVNNYVNDDSSEELPAKAQQVYSIGSYQESDSLYLWLKKRRLEEIFPMLVKNGYSDITGLMEKMNSEESLKEVDLSNMRIKKQGLRVRLLYKLEEECIKRTNQATKIRHKYYPDLQGFLEDYEMQGLYDKLTSQGFYFIEDLIYLDQKCKLTEALSLMNIKDQDIFKLKVLIDNICSDTGERAIDSTRRIANTGKVGDCGFCCAFKSIFN